jgi:hypothetical protein
MSLRPMGTQEGEEPSIAHRSDGSVIRAKTLGCLR